MELPLVVQRPLRGPSGQAVVTLLNPAGAVFDADDVELTVECGRGTDVTLATASATRLNCCDVHGSAFSLDATVAEGAVLRYLPYELIPFRGARYHQQVRVRLAAGAGVALLEVIGAGRSGDRFAYSRLEFVLEVTLAEERRLAVRERFVLAEQARDSLDGHTHYASLLMLGTGPSPASASATLVGLGVRGAASLLPAGGVGLKALGDAALALREALLLAGECPAWLRSLLPP